MLLKGFYPGFAKLPHLPPLFYKTHRTVNLVAGMHKRVLTRGFNSQLMQVDLTWMRIPVYLNISCIYGVT